jgi:2,3-bisphosphoglycerate-dependent phosphoglycerate mutase
LFFFATANRNGISKTASPVGLMFPFRPKGRRRLVKREKSSSRSDSIRRTIPIEYDRALNERHYGALQGLNKADIGRQYGEQQLKIWRRSYDVPPPKDKTELNPEGISESLKDTAARTLPYFETKILPDIRAGKNVLVAAHGNSLRSIVMKLDNLSKEEVLELNIPTGIPLLYVYDDAGTIVEHRYL